MLRSGKALTAAAAALLTVLGVSVARPAHAEDPAFLSLSAGYFDIIDGEHAGASAWAEYRHDKRFWIFKPMVGAMVASHGEMYGYAGVLVDIYFGRRWVLTPSFAPGLYWKGNSGDAKDLGNTIEFKSQLELSYRFDDRSRLGIAFNHMSNANLGEHNPGVENLMLTYSLPLGGK
ncbi:MAG TPA: acyloxyacyl hydrolase [Ferrovibrio sp.]|uniref:acyloxyacyl hydrolase n=1 Tax=Ferrovibrio sp. TaxID=1917215 RepID=UPI002ED6107E